MKFSLSKLLYITFCTAVYLGLLMHFREVAELYIAVASLTLLAVCFSRWKILYVLPFAAVVNCFMCDWYFTKFEDWTAFFAIALPSIVSIACIATDRTANHVINYGGLNELYYRSIFNCIVSGFLVGLMISVAFIACQLPGYFTAALPMQTDTRCLVLCCCSGILLGLFLWPVVLCLTYTVVLKIDALKT